MSAPYASLIAPLAKGYDPRHVEAYMRVEHSTLDGLDRERFKYEVSIAMCCIDQGGLDAAERLAQSYGF